MSPLPTRRKGVCFVGVREPGTVTDVTEDILERGILCRP